MMNGYEWMTSFLGCEIAGCHLGDPRGLDPKSWDHPFTGTNFVNEINRRSLRDETIQKRFFSSPQNRTSKSCYQNSKSGFSPTNQKLANGKASFHSSPFFTKKSTQCFRLSVIPHHVSLRRSERSRVPSWKTPRCDGLGEQNGEPPLATTFAVFHGRVC